MIFDDNLVFVNSGALASSITPAAVALNSFLHPGKMDAVPVYVCATKNTSGTSASITVGFQESEHQTSGFSAVGPTWTVTAAQLASGVPVGPRYLPREVTKPWIKMTISKAGTFSAGALTAAIVREDYQPYAQTEMLEA